MAESIRIDDLPASSARGRILAALARNTGSENVHFDNRQYNFIKWEKDNLPQFKEKLQYRIEATIGHGTFDLRNKLG